MVKSTRLIKIIKMLLKILLQLLDGVKLSRNSCKRGKMG